MEQSIINRIENLFSYRPRSQSEIVTYLKTKFKLPPEKITVYINYFVDIELINDSRFAKWILDTRTYGSKVKSKIGVTYELKTFGISNEIISNTLTQSNIEEFESETKQKLVKKISRELKLYNENAVSEKAINKIMQKYTKKGFNYSLIKEIIDIIKK